MYQLDEIKTLKNNITLLTSLLNDIRVHLDDVSDEMNDDLNQFKMDSVLMKYNVLSEFMRAEYNHFTKENMKDARDF